MAVRGLAFCLLIGALGCDLQPAKQREKSTAGAVVPTPAPPPVEPVPPPTVTEPSPLPANAGFVQPRPAKPGVETTEDCTEVASHITTLAIAAIEDPTERAVQNQDSTRMVRKLAELCTTNKWSAEAKACFLASKVGTDVEACGKKHIPMPTAAQPPG